MKLSSIVLPLCPYTNSIIWPLHILISHPLHSRRTLREKLFYIKNVLFFIRSWRVHHMVICSKYSLTMIILTLLNFEVNNKNLWMKLNTIICIHYFCLKFKGKKSSSIKLNICLGTWPSRSIKKDDTPNYDTVCFQLKEDVRIRDVRERCLTSVSLSPENSTLKGRSRKFPFSFCRWVMESRPPSKISLKIKKDFCCSHKL